MADREIKLRLTAEDFTAGGLRSAGKSLDKFRDTQESRIKQLKGLFGEESTLGSLGKIAVGSGAVAGLSMIGNQIGAMLDGVNEHLKEFQRTGTWSTQRLVDKTVEGLPIVGRMYKSLGETIQTTGEIWAKQAWNIKTAKEPAGAESRRLRDIGETQKPFDAIARDIASSRGQIAAGDTDDDEKARRFAMIDKEYEDRRRAIEEAKKAEIDAIIKLRGMPDNAESRVHALSISGRSIDFQEADIGAARLRDEQKKQFEEDRAKRIEEEDEKRLREKEDSERQMRDAFARDRANTERDHQEQMKRLNAQVTESRLRRMGIDAGANQVSAAESYRSRLADIKANFDDQFKLHPEAEDDLRRRAKDMADVARAGYREDLAGIVPIRPTSALAPAQQTGALTGVAEAANSRQVTDQAERQRDQTNQILKDISTDIAELLKAFQNIPVI